ncbi:MAG TPA: hypothetical protein PKH77_14270 [Anaerolineae bacterium]|nr:hypothetical protein [Anaerolineae bacterium]
MIWEEVRQHYPSQWLLIEAIKAHSDQGKRVLDAISVVNTFPDSKIAMQVYGQLHQESPERELYVFHTDRKILEIEERQWLGIRSL